MPGLDAAFALGFPWRLVGVAAVAALSFLPVQMPLTVRMALRRRVVDGGLFRRLRDGTGASGAVVLPARAPNDEALAGRTGNLDRPSPRTFK